MDSPGGVKAAETLQKLTDEGIFKPSVSYDIAREAFGKGKSPYFITGPWQIPEQQEALGDDLMVCPIPSWAGSEYKSTPFLGVRAFFQTAKAKNPMLASTFLNDEVMTTEFMDQMFAVDPRPPAWLESYQKASTDVVIKAFGDYGADGVPMPNIPQMANVFGEPASPSSRWPSGASPPPTCRRPPPPSTRRTATSAEPEQGQALMPSNTAVEEREDVDDTPSPRSPRTTARSSRSSWWGWSTPC